MANSTTCRRRKASLAALTTVLCVGGLPLSTLSFYVPTPIITLNHSQRQQQRRIRFGIGSTLIVAATQQPKRQRSRVEDPDGATPELEQKPVDIVDINTIEELREIYDPDELPRPIPYQSWRRGDTAGCEAPIAAQWRKDAEQEIIKAVQLVGGRVLDVTWFLTTVLVTLDDETMPPKDFIKDRGPAIDIIEPGPPVYYDPADPEPEELWDDEDDVLYERETEAEAAMSAERKKNMYAPVSPDDDDPNETRIPIEVAMNDIPLFRNEETRDDVAPLVAEELQERYADSQQPLDLDTIRIDTAVLSTIGYAIVEALKFHEQEWRILARHELILSSPNPAIDCLETQRQFDAYRNHHVVVETQDPFESNRTLKGKLVDRNAMDLILNIRGHMVTVPLNFVKCVRLPPGSVAVQRYEDLVENEYVENEDMIEEEYEDDEEEEFDDDE
jgi:ribosome maturation factor RimP